LLGVINTKMMTNKTFMMRMNKTLSRPDNFYMLDSGSIRVVVCLLQSCRDATRYRLSVKRKVKSLGPASHMAILRT
jgi:hypothetical protein